LPLHGLTDITLGVSNPEEAAEYYTEFGLTPLQPAIGQNEHLFATADGGHQLRIVYTPVRKLVSLGLGADNHDDLKRIEAALHRLDVPSRIEGDRLTTHEPLSGLEVVVTVAPPLVITPRALTPQNTPGVTARPNVRAASLLRTEPVRPRRLGHVALGSTDKPATMRFFIEGLGFKVSDEIGTLAAFLRCSTDHHNVVVQESPVNFLHHTSWEVDDVDEIARGARSLLENHPERHVWGLGRHWVGANYFYYFRDPSGHSSEYFSDMDRITEDEAWKPEVHGEVGGILWGNGPVAPSLISPDDLAELMADQH
jgi:catechol-2,3-dioxygenase